MEGPAKIILTLVVLVCVLDPSFPLKSPSSEQYSKVLAGNGSTLCAIDSASSLESASTRLRCGQKCVLQPFCYHFNYYAKKKQCAMFYNPPQRFAVLADCSSYKAQPQPRAMRIIADEIIKDIYADGLRIPLAPEVYDVYMSPGTFYFPRSARILAIRITNTYIGSAGLLASEINGNLLTNTNWKVQCNYTDGWMDSTFDDSGWENASVVTTNPGSTYIYEPSISTKAVWISSPSNPMSQVLFFRVHL